MKVYVSKMRAAVSQRLGSAYLDFLVACGSLGTREVTQEFMDMFEDEIQSMYYKYRGGRPYWYANDPWQVSDIVKIRKWYLGLSFEDRKRALKGLVWSVNDGGLRDREPREYVNYILNKEHLYNNLGSIAQDLTFLVSAFADSYGLCPKQDAKKEAKAEE